jgi:hypothetical protein
MHARAAYNETLPRWFEEVAIMPTLRRYCILIAASMVVPALAVAAVLAGNSTEGKRLLEANCFGCHDTSVYTRSPRSVRSLDALKQQLEMCGHASAKDLSAADKQNIVKYLNDQYYRFP